MQYEKRIYEPLRTDFNYEWHQNKFFTRWKIISMVFALFFFLLIMAFNIMFFPYIIFMIVFSIPLVMVIVVLVTKKRDYPIQVGIFSHGIVFDYNGKYEYIYYQDINSFQEYNAFSYRYLVINKKDGSFKTLGYVDSNINAIIERILNYLRILSYPTKNL
jgi:hypothetical protein